MDVNDIIAAITNLDIEERLELSAILKNTDVKFTQKPKGLFLKNLCDKHGFYIGGTVKSNVLELADYVTGNYVFSKRRKDYITPRKLLHAPADESSFKQYESFLNDIICLLKKYSTEVNVNGILRFKYDDLYDAERNKQDE